MAKFENYFYATLLVLAAASITFADVEFRFSSVYGDHMVLQQAPKQAIVWGYGEIGQRVVLRLRNKSYHAQVSSRQEGFIAISLYKAESSVANLRIS